MRSLALFKPTFQRIQNTLQHSQIIKDKVLPAARRRPILQRLERTMFLLNCIEHTAMDIQSAEVQTQLQSFQMFLDYKNMTSSYDYDGKGFKIVNETPFNEKIKNLQINLRSIGVQKFDHPFLRESLYFHQLKDIDQLMKIKYPRNAPRFIKDLYRRNVENDILDKKNPLGLPIKAPPLQLILQFDNKFATELYCRYGYINIRSVRLLQQISDEAGQPHIQCYHVLKGLNIPRPVQKVFYQLCQESLGLNESEYYLLHKLAYIGGRVEQVQFLLKLYEFYTDNISIE